MMTRLLACISARRSLASKCRLRRTAVLLLLHSSLLSAKICDFGVLTLAAAALDLVHWIFVPAARSLTTECRLQRVAALDLPHWSFVASFPRHCFGKQLFSEAGHCSLLPYSSCSRDRRRKRVRHRGLLWGGGASQARAVCLPRFRCPQRVQGSQRSGVTIAQLISVIEDFALDLLRWILVVAARFLASECRP